MTLERGTLLHKRYRIVEILGQGGMGSVYRAVDENLGLDVAVKENLFTTDEYSRQFRLEAVILANLRHPDLPRVSDHFAMDDQGQYLVMDFIEGEDLRQRMERFGTVTEDDAVMVGAAICDALSYLHTRKPAILHRDIKPGNVKITPDGHIFLVDFGLAKIVQGSQATTTGARAMTPGYSPPEQYGTARTDPRTDIYSLGATLYASLCGVIPEDGLARAMDNAQLTPLRKRNPKISRRLAAAIEKAMAIDPADRYQDAEEFKKALLAAKSKTQRLTGEYTVVPPPEVPEDEKAAQGLKGRVPTGPVPPAPIDEDQVFVPPSKRYKNKSKSNGSGKTLAFYLLLLAALLGVAYYFPGILPEEVRAAMPFLPAAGTSLGFPATSPTSTPPPTGTATLAPPSATFTAVPTKLLAGVVTETLIPGPATETPTPGPTPIGAGDGQIAFASERSGIAQIYLSDLLGENVVPITNMPAGACQPSWSPDGTQLVFVSPCASRLGIGDNPPQNTSLYIINTDGSELTPLPTAPGGDFEPAWSPDGGRIAFTSLRDGHMQIYTLNLADQTATRLTETDADIETRQPAWSPFNNQIAYAAKRFGAYQIWTMTDMGQGQQQIIHSGQEFWDYLPVWSPDGREILFTQRRVGSPPSPPWQMSITYEDRNSEQAIRMNLGSLPIEDAEYSQDGFWLVFEGEGDKENKDVFYIMVTGAGRTRLTKDPGVDFDPVWRPITP